MNSLDEEENDSIHINSTHLRVHWKFQEDPLQIPNKEISRQANGLELAINKCLVIEKELKTNEDIFTKSCIYLEVQIKLESKMRRNEA